MTRRNLAAKSIPKNQAELAKLEELV